MNGLWARLLCAIYPPRAVCLSCGAVSGCDEDWLCPACRAELAGQHPGGDPVGDLSGVHCAYWYGSCAGRLVRQMKYGGMRCLSPLLARSLAGAMNDACWRYDVISPVPMHRRRQYLRGFNQSQLLAEDLSRLTGIPIRPLLKRIRATRPQAQLSGEARRRNLVGAFRADSAVQGLRVLLVDDVYTTGETAQRCARALKAAGAWEVRLLAVCHAGDETGGV